MWKSFEISKKYPQILKTNQICENWVNLQNPLSKNVFLNVEIWMIWGKKLEIQKQKEGEQLWLKNLLKNCEIYKTEWKYFFKSFFLIPVTLRFFGLTHNHRKHCNINDTKSAFAEMSCLIYHHF